MTLLTTSHLSLSFILNRKCPMLIYMIKRGKLLKISVLCSKLRSNYQKYLGGWGDSKIKYKMTKFDYKLDCNLRLQFSQKKINMVTYFENLIIRLHVFTSLTYITNFHANQRLFTYLIHKFFFFFYIILNYKNLKFKNLIDDII